MLSSARVITISAVVLTVALFSSAADKKSKDAKADDSSKPSYDLPQPATESLDLHDVPAHPRGGPRSLARDGVRLRPDDDIGPRLTGSQNLKHANEWTRDQFTAMGCNECASGRLGRVRHGLEATQHLGSHVSAGHCCVYRAGAALVAGQQRRRERRTRSGSTSKTRRIWTNTRANLPARLSSSARCAMCRRSTSRCGRASTMPN